MEKRPRSPGVSSKTHFSRDSYQSTSDIRRCWEFQTLVKGHVTVMEYSNKFTKLSNFADELVAMEKMKKDKFVEGLRPDIKKDEHLHALQTYNKALKKAFVFEQASRGLNVNDQPQPSGNKKGDSKSQAPPKRQKIEARAMCDFYRKGHDV